MRVFEGAVIQVEKVAMSIASHPKKAQGSNSNTTATTESALNETPPTDTPQQYGDAAIALATTWAHESSEETRTQKGPAALLAKVLEDPTGLEFATGFVDRVVRPEDNVTAARELRALALPAPKFLPWYLRTVVALGGVLAPVLPHVVVPLARRILRKMVGHLIIDARPSQLGTAIAKVRKDDVRLNLNLLGEAVLGEHEAKDRFEGTIELLKRDDVDYVSIKDSAVISQLSMWARSDTINRVIERVLPLYKIAAESKTPKFINLDMEEYRDLELTIEVFTGLLDKPELKHLSAGIVLQAYLPDALGALQRITKWAQARVDAGGAPVKVRIVKGANLAMERVDAAVHDWPLATVPNKQAADTNYMRVLDWALRPEHTRAVKIGVAGHNLFTVAFARVLSKARGVTDDVEFEMLLGMAEGQQRVVREDTGEVLLYTPVVSPDQFDSAISYLIRRLEENASSQNFMSAAFHLDDTEMFGRERDRFKAALAAVERAVPHKNRVQDRAHDKIVPITGGFENVADTDTATRENQAWIDTVYAQMSNAHDDLDKLATKLESTDDVEAVVAAGIAAQLKWTKLDAHKRAEVLRAASVAIQQNRGELLAIMAPETGKTLAEGDPEVSEASDFANYYAEQAELLSDFAGAKFEPAKLTLVTPPWNFPLAIPTGSVVSALATGSAVIFKPAPQARKIGAQIAKMLWAAGVPKDVLQLVDAPENEIGQALVAHKDIDQTILTGAYDTARMFTEWNPETRVLAETSGKNSIIVMPSADIDLAVSDVAKSAFGHAGQKCSAASLVILVGAVAKSKRFMRQLEDYVKSIHVGLATVPQTLVGPVIEPASGKLERGLTELEPGQSWLVKPQKLDEEGRLWRPGVRLGVKAGSDFHQTEFFGPILGVMVADSLEEALTMQNGVAYGLTAGIHTLDPNDLTAWLSGVEAGNLYVNRGITGAIVRRQPFGGWKRSSVGAGAKAGGPNYLSHLGTWVATDSSAHDGDWLATAQAADRQAKATYFADSDVSALGLERNVFRYLPTAATIRVGADATAIDVARVISAAGTAGVDAAELAVSVDPGFKGIAALRKPGIAVSEHTKDEFAARLANGTLPSRVRMVGETRAEISKLMGADAVDVQLFDGDVVLESKLEMFPFLREQAVSITAHRFGEPSDWSEQALPIA